MKSRALTASGQFSTSIWLDPKLITKTQSCTLSQTQTRCENPCGRAAWRRIQTKSDKAGIWGHKGVLAY